MVTWPALLVVQIEVWYPDFVGVHVYAADASVVTCIPHEERVGPILSRKNKSIGQFY